MPAELVRVMNRLIAEKTLVVVEGKRDIESLQELGFENIRMLNAPLFEVVEDVARMTKTVAVLTDLDSKGKELHNKLSEDFQRHGVAVDDTFRKFLLKNTPIKHIEGLATFVKNHAE